MILSEMLGLNNVMKCSCDYSVFHSHVYPCGVVLFDNLMTAVILKGYIWLSHGYTK